MKIPEGTVATLIDIEENFLLWAKVAAKLLRRTRDQRENILNELGVADRWPVATRHWNDQMQQRLRAGDPALSRHYGDICAAELRRRETEGDDSVPEPTAAAPTDLPGAIPQGDFRQAVMRPSSSPPPSSQPPHSLPASAALPFAEQMHARNEVQPPRHNQTATIAASFGPAQEAALRTLSWPVERYAELCFVLAAHPTRSTETFAHYGIVGPEACQYTQQLWGDRLTHDPTLAQRFAAAMHDLRAKPG